MRSHSPRLVVSVALVAGPALGIVGTVGANSLVSSPTSPKRPAVAYDDRRNAGHDRHARDESASETETA
jgi:hypothetical protein